MRLDDFRAEFHPGVRKARSYESWITASADGADVKHHIYMNAPLRRDGFTLYQSSWGPQGGSERDRLFSVFSIVTNPADSWPLWSCVVIGLGMLIHFTVMLVRYAMREARARAEVTS